MFSKELSGVVRINLQRSLPKAKETNRKAVAGVKAGRGGAWQGRSLTKAGVGCGSRTKGTEATDGKESHSRK